MMDVDPSLKNTNVYIIGKHTHGSFARGRLLGWHELIKRVSNNLIIYFMVDNLITWFQRLHVAISPQPSSLV